MTATQRAIQWTGLVYLVFTFAVALPAELPVYGQEQDGGKDSADAATQEPQRSDVVERALGRLYQLDVTVTGPEDAIKDLGVEDFDLVVNSNFMEEFFVDRVCRSVFETPAPDSEPVDDSAESGAEPAATPAPVAGPRATFLMYFDQVHLSLAGRSRALQMARDLVPQLVSGGAVSVVSSGRGVETFAEYSEDEFELLEALEKLEYDRNQWDEWTQLEERRFADINRYLVDDRIDQAISMARFYAKEERYRAEKALYRLSMVLGRLATRDQPKVVIYFSDSMRRNPGRHYLDLFNQNLVDRQTEDQGTIENDSQVTAVIFDRVIQEAAAHGIRVYAVEAQGMVVQTNRSGALRATPTTSSGLRDAQGSLQSLAIETGGQAFISSGVSAKSIRRNIEKDLSCLYLVSFDPTGMPLDRSIPVRLDVKRPRVKAQVRGTIVLQSEEARRKSALLAAFGATEKEKAGISANSPIRAGMLPLGFEDGKFKARLQVYVDGSPLPGAKWDVGASVVAEDRVPLEASGRIEVDQPNIPVVLETEAYFKPGSYEVVMVAHETESDHIVSRRVENTWPNPKAQPVAVSPISIVQRTQAAFHSGGEIRTSGNRALGQGELVKADEDTAFVGMICWDRGQRKPLRITRTLSGDSSADFPPMEMEPGDERCRTFADLVAPGTMTAGSFTYEVKVHSDDEELASGKIVFGATDRTAAR
ncbi:hypothetical protein ABI59_23260 [Acidobacteria bacterium Mor1]|nr:hypothetical protein ABI59_23260 [Acidobacteria bacterium Mor1]